MRSTTWVILTLVAISLMLASITRGYGELDAIAIAMLISISVYVLLRYTLPVYLELPLRSMVSLDFRYIEAAVRNSVLFTLLSLTIDSLVVLVYPRTLLSIILSAIAAVAVLSIAKKFFGLKVLRIIMIASIFVLATLYMLGYTEEEPILLIVTTHILWCRL